MTFRWRRDQGWLYPASTEERTARTSSGPPINVLREPTTVLPPVWHNDVRTGNDLICLYLPVIIVLRDNGRTTRALY